MISVIVPVYNMEKYLDQCVASILNQKYQDIEVLLVDDGSKDNSAEICRQYAQKDDRMLEYAQILSKEFPFCRVDFYNVDGKIIFGEITFFHAGGLSKITPEEWELKLGEFINIDKILQL